MLFKKFEISENCPIVTWQEPDYLNILGICKEDLPSIFNTVEKIDEQLREIFDLFENELFNREVLYYRHLLRKEISDAEFNKIILNLKIVDEKYAIPKRIRKNSGNDIKEGYAVLENKNSRFFIIKNASVVGREKKSLNGRASWQVDINLKDNFKCSKQHALIIYNFEQEKFEIKCLSYKFPLEVDGKKYTFTDEPIPLFNGSSVGIGDENFHFLTAKNEHFSQSSSKN